MRLLLFFAVDNKKCACSSAENKDDPKKDRAALNEHGEYEIVDEEA